MIDLHTHILPGIDDGAAHPEGSRRMARAYLAAGVTHLVATPHIWPGRYDNAEDSIRTLCEQTRADWEANDIGLVVLPGAEYYWHEHLLEKFNDPARLVTLADRGRHVLVEFSNSTRPLGLREALFELKLKGVTLVMAHPERYAWIAEDLDFAEELVSGGLLMQGTLARMLGVFGSRPRKTLKTLLDRDLIHLMSSDVHVHSQVPACYGPAVTRLVEWVGEKRARLLLADNPGKILRGETV